MPRNNSKEYFEKVWRYVEEIRQTYKKGKLPAVVVVCGIGQNKKTGKSGEFLRKYRRNVSSHHICTALTRLAPIEKKWNDSYGREHTIGTCAENDAADEVLKSYPNKKLASLNFSDAYRPRTRRIIKYCEVCQKTYGL